MTIEEKTAWRHWSTNYKIESGKTLDEQQKERRRNASYKKGWLTKDENILNLLSDGIEKFEERVAQRILNEEDITFNNCPNCGKLTRTPRAKQCRHCRHDWH